MNKCSCCENLYVPDQERMECFPDSNTPNICDACFWDVLNSKIEKTDKKIKLLENMKSRINDEQDV